jgi:DNA repair exonuclease SbcCD ATPase subunit
MSEEIVEKPRIEVVTNENFNDYVDERMGIDREAIAQQVAAKEEAEKAAQEERAKAVEEDPTLELEEHEEKVPEIKNKRGRLQERFSELTSKRKEAEAQAEEARKIAEEARKEAEEARRQAEELKERYEPKKEPLGEKPKPEDFTDINEYSKALEDFAAEKAIRERQEAEAKEKTEREQRETLERFQKKQAEFMANTPDYQQVLNDASDIVVSDEVKAAILDADNGPEILYALASDKDYAKALAEMPSHRALREIGKMEAKFSTPDKSEEAKTPVTEISKAPEPIKPLKGASNPVTALRGSDEVPNTMSYEEWKAKRKAGQIR